MCQNYNRGKYNNSYLHFGKRISRTIYLFSRTLCGQSSHQIEKELLEKQIPRCGSQKRKGKASFAEHAYQQHTTILNKINRFFMNSGFK